MDQLNLPEKFVQRIHALYDPENARTILASFDHSKRLVIRTNTLKTDTKTLAHELKKAGIQTDVIPWCSYALVIRNADARKLTALTQYNDGHFYIQTGSSLIPPILLNPKSTDTLLDMTASPGGKTTHLAALMNNKGLIIANDSGSVRMYKLIQTLKRMGVTNTKTEHRDGRALWQIYPEKFESVLLDAPCSMEAQFSHATLEALNWSVKKIKHLSRLQKYLLRSAISCTRVGGTIVYSTCTFSPEENEAVINWAITKEKGNVELIQAETPTIPHVSGRTSWQDTLYSSTMTRTVRILPSEITEGFFVAILKKIAPTVHT